MSSVRFYNQTAPSWDSVAGLEDQANHRGAEASNNQNERPNPGTEGWNGFPWGPIPHRGHYGPPQGHPHGPQPPTHLPGPPPPLPFWRDGEEAGPTEPRGPPSPMSDSDNEGGRRRGRHGHGHHGPGAHSGRCGRGGPRVFGAGGRGQSHPYCGFGPLGQFAEMFQNHLFSGEQSNNEENDNKSEDFKPEVDVFDTTDSFVFHVSLPGAKKEDVGVHWDAEKSELSIAGVVHRPGDEELLKTLAMAERKTGAFERKVRLGSRANPAQVDVDGISARLEDGVLRVNVPKLDHDYIEIKKVDIE